MNENPNITGQVMLGVFGGGLALVLVVVFWQIALWLVAIAIVLAAGFWVWTQMLISDTFRNVVLAGVVVAIFIWLIMVYGH